MALNYTPHYLLRLGGKMGPERWSIGLRLDSNQDKILVGAFSEAMCEVVEGHARTYFNALKSFMPSGVDWDFISCNQIGVDGKYTQDVSYERYVTPVAGSGVATSWMGPDVAVVATLMTDKQRGYGSRGRIYLPLQTGLNLTYSTNGWGEIGTSQRATIGTATATFLSELNDLGVDLTTNNPALSGSNVFVCVFSPGTGKKQDMTQRGAYHRVTSVRVGAQPDTQRRRVNKQTDLWDDGAGAFPVTG